MDVRELISQLVDCEMESTVEVIINSNGYDETFDDIKCIPKKIFQNGYAQMFVDIGSMILVEKNEYDELKNRIEELEHELENARNK